MTHSDKDTSDRADFYGLEIYFRRDSVGTHLIDWAHQIRGAEAMLIPLFESEPKGSFGDAVRLLLMLAADSRDHVMIRHRRDSRYPTSEHEADPVSQYPYNDADVRGAVNMFWSDRSYWGIQQLLQQHPEKKQMLIDVLAQWEREHTQREDRTRIWQALSQADPYRLRHSGAYRDIIDHNTDVVRRLARDAGGFISNPDITQSIVVNVTDHRMSLKEAIGDVLWRYFRHEKTGPGLRYMSPDARLMEWMIARLKRHDGLDQGVSAVAAE